MPDTKPKPAVGETVHFYDPELTSRIGFFDGYGGRKEGPYAAIVVNDNDPGEELDLFVLYPAKQPAFVREKIKGKPEGEAKKAYWDYINPTQKARAVKRHADAAPATA